MMLRRLFFNLKYFQNPPWDTGISPPELLAFIQSHPPGRAIDLGCGTGTNVLTLAKAGWDALGIDFAWRAVRTGQRKLRHAGVQARLQVGDVTRLDQISGLFDLVLDIGCLHSLSSAGRELYRQGVGRLLAPGGTYLVYTFLQTTPGSQGPGIGQDEIDAMAQMWTLTHRADGTERGMRPSAWLTFEKPV